MTFLGAFLLATGSGIVDIENLYLFLLGNTVATITTMALAALGGAFVGMLAGHYISSSQSFTPFERRVVETLDGLEDVSEQMDGLEERLAGDLEELQEEVEELRGELDRLLEERQAR